MKNRRKRFNSQRPNHERNLIYFFKCKDAFDLKHVARLSIGAPYFEAGQAGLFCSLRGSRVKSTLSSVAGHNAPQLGSLDGFFSQYS